MGYPYNDLIAPVVLMNNPGITREEFVMLLDKTHSSNIYEYKTEELMDSYTEKNEDWKYHDGLKGLADILGIQYSQQFKKLQISRIDKNGLVVHAPYVLPGEINANYKFEVVVHEKNVFEEPKIEESVSWNKMGVGDIWEHPMGGSMPGLVLKIYKEKKYRNRKNNRDDSDSPDYFYKMKIRPIRGEYREELFNSEQELYEKWPRFDPKFNRDWSQKSGFLTTAYDVLSKTKFLWVQEKDKYYFDERTLENISAGFSCSSSFGYTDLILTSEAVKHNAWKVLSYKGLQHLNDFLKQFPDVISVYEKAIWDSHTSLVAKSKQMSVSEFLRFRLLPQNNLTKSA